jgi:hypothetical protein
MSEKHQAKLKDKIFEAYGKAWKEEEIDSKTDAIKDNVKICCQNADLVSKISFIHINNLSYTLYGYFYILLQWLLDMYSQSNAVHICECRAFAIRRL